MARADAPIPTVEGPILGPGAAFVAATTFDLAAVGYQQQEFFFSGTASSYVDVGTLDSDGLWTVAPADSAAFKTRMLVYRPIDPRRFRGTVIVEWLNVSGGLDSAPDWISAHTEMIRSGMAWVGISAQSVGVEGGGGGLISLPLKTVNPARYGSLSHPGDSFSYDMYSQAGQAVRSLPELVLGGLAPERVIAAGESQSAFRMVTYINAVHPEARVYDAFLVHSRGAGGAPLSQAPQTAIPVPRPLFLRTDQATPILTFQTETDMTLLGYFADRQPDGGSFRLWEVAGTAHADYYTLRAGMTDLGDDPEVAKVKAVADPLPGIIVCGSPVNHGPQHFVLDGAIAALDRWVRRGKPPTSAPRLQIDPGPPVTIERDAYGNALGGIRTPWVDSPVATLRGDGQSGSGFCFLFGTTALFDDVTLRSLYPTRATYRRAYRRSVRDALRAGFLVRRDARLLRKASATTYLGE